MRSRVNLYTMGAGRGPGDLIGCIEDAEEVGWAEYANDKGESYFTLPYGHWAHDYVLPLATHIEIQRQASVGQPWVSLGFNLVADDDITADDTVYYGDDYLSLFASSFTPLKTKYSKVTTSAIIQAEAQAAISQSGVTSATTANLGYYAKPAAMAIHEAVGGKNQQEGDTVTIAANGTIPRLGGWISGYLTNCNVRFYVRDSDTDTILGQTATVAMAGVAFKVANILRREYPVIATTSVTAGQHVRFGWVAENTHALQYAATGTSSLTGTHYTKKNTGTLGSTLPGSMAGATTEAGAIGAYGYFVASAVSSDSRLGFLTIGHIDTTAMTTSIPESDYQSRLELMRNMAQITQAGTSTRPIMTVSRSSPFTFDFYANKGQERPELQLDYGGLVNGFHVRGGYGLLATQILGIGQQLSGSTILYSSQTSMPSSTYGLIQKPVVFSLVLDQASLDSMTKTEALKAAQLNKDLYLLIRSNALAPYAGFAIGDSMPVMIHRGKASLTRAYYTLWGMEWLAHGDGSEELRMVWLPEVGGTAAAQTLTRPPTVIAPRIGFRSSALGSLLPNPPPVGA